MAVRGPLWFITRRIASSILTVFGLATIVFIMTKFIPGDEARVVAGSAATPAQVEYVRTQLGLDASVGVQYWRYMDGLAHGNLGTSIVSHNAVLTDIRAVLPSTVQLALLALVLALVLSVPTAILAASRRGSRSDSTARVLVIVAAGLPTFWLALLLQWLFGDKLNILPVSGALNVGVDVPSRTGMTLADSLLAGNLSAFGDAFEHLVLPASVLALPIAAQFFRALRTEMLSVLEREHITVARAKGVSASRLLLRHALPNGFGPVLTLVGINFGILIASTVVVESVFGLSGIGAYIYNAVNQKDIDAVLGSVVVIGVFVVVANLLVDVCQLIRDPRLRSGELGGASRRG